MTCEIFLTGTSGIGKTSFLNWLIKLCYAVGIGLFLDAENLKENGAKCDTQDQTMEKSTLR